MSVDVRTVELIERLVALSPKTQKEIAESIGWSQPPMNGALKGQRSFPPTRVLPILGAVGVGPDIKPLPGTVWRGICEQSELDAVMSVLRRFVDQDCGAFEVVRGRAPRRGRVSLSDYNAPGVTILGFVCRNLGVRGVLSIHHDPDPNEEFDWRPPQVAEIAKELGVTYLGVATILRGEFRVWNSKDALTVEEFDAVAGQVSDTAGPTWDDVRARLEELIKEGADPAVVLRALG
ncbi:hypothetical protein [Magnetospirillum sp. SS-4]|uniref:hypothetical protein n=1 Tax=Magnetospirillum sp. SS-4 TaxID=2681465 RepID=UPI001385A03B|nr:hypothetical protein [Magnetospirillum sp. SS-4]CAA7619022.1 hypothetical protein MTBSS4_230019 [Magnetospirillum sp. SS-4]